jgi:periplasmic divalent cation tolerance protein
MEKNITALIVLTTTATLDDARTLGRRLVEEHLAACATIIPAVESIYHWQGAIEESKEVLLLFKTAEDKLEALEVRLNQVHPYQNPEFLVLNVDSGGSKYLQWLSDSLRS